MLELRGLASAHGLVPTLPAPIDQWFAARGWQPWRYQLDMLDAYQQGEHALLVAPTGAGKTLAGFLATLADLALSPSEGLHTLYISPLKVNFSNVYRDGSSGILVV